MTATLQIVHNETGLATVRVNGTFNPRDVERLARLVTDLHVDRTVTVDFHGAVVEDEAVARFAKWFTWGGGVQWVGLCEHHHRLLRYMGLEGDGPAALDLD